ncbi:MAG: 4Fe-4S dicluster domain-containing protein [Erysipelotrichaceae bacterium]|nr:4Fe-4S dicluster domain-containing protein [Erysipelotrichaceae bacterium]
MKGVETNKNLIRRRVFEAIARLAYEGGKPEDIKNLPYEIIPGEVATYRESIFLERAIIEERLRAALGLPLRDITEHTSVIDGIEESMVPETYYKPPLIDIIKFACYKCPEKRVFVTDGCQGCLEHPCMEVCPKGAITFKNGRSYIDDEKCVKCGLCVNACQYNAIIKQERPCVKSCGVNAIKSDQFGRAVIDQDRCVSCGMCLVNCPFGAIVDKGQIYQTIMAIKSETPVYAIVAPAIAGQFGKQMSDNKIRPAFRALGFTDVYEVALGADMCTIQEANDFLEEVPSKIPFMGTSCCPAWNKMAQRDFPKYANTISMALTPMVLTARLIKTEHPDCKICFIGPCLSKKEEASRTNIKSYVDFTLTFEEVAGMFEALDVDIAALPADVPLKQASSDGRGFAASGGVASAVKNYINKLDPDIDVKIVKGEGLAECKRMMMMAARGKYNGYLLEGMACPGGCISGAGTLQTIMSSSRSLQQSQREATFQRAGDTIYASWIKDLVNIEQTLKKE